MKQFFGAFFGSIIGILLAVFFAVILVVAVVKASIGSALKGKADTEVVGDRSLLRLSLSGVLNERERENPFEQLGEVAPLVDVEEMGLNTLLRRIRTASRDKSVKGIYIRFERFRAGLASLSELREALKDFRNSGKFIYSYSEDYTQSQYYLASVANKVFIYPQGSLEWKGLAMNLLFFKNMFEKLDVDLQVFRHGRFKSAIEPFVLDKMSGANRLQAEAFLNNIWQTMLSDISASRKVPVADLDRMASDLSIRFPEDAKGTLIDAIAYEDEVHAELKKKLGRKETEKLAFMDCSRFPVKPETEGKTEGRIAVIYVNGQITSGDGLDDEAGSIRMCRALREARLDDKVKAIVLRVNSPGGSALASDVIWREVVLARKAKPTVVSMGDVAASGGYYISCAADRIFAQANTITGSIGVFGLMPNIARMLENKLGITMDTVNTNSNSDFMSVLRPVTEKEREFIQASVEKVYEEFTKKVSEGRNITQAEVDSIGQGRVWTGADAQKMKLVDEMGGLSEAIAYAAKKAKISVFRIIELPRLKGPFDGLFNNAEKEVREKALSGALGAAYPYFKHLRTMLDAKGVQARLPFEMIIN